MQTDHYLVKVSFNLEVRYHQVHGMAFNNFFNSNSPKPISAFAIQMPIG
jgi:hypothetical protein